jgi:hypothetical protein
MIFRGRKDNRVETMETAKNAVGWGIGIKSSQEHAQAA